MHPSAGEADKIMEGKKKEAGQWPGLSCVEAVVLAATTS
jgi:hypothetical protein